VSFALTAPVAALIGVRATLVGAAIIGTGATAAALLIPGIRDIEGHDPRSDPAAPGQSARTAARAA
jgi:hypothetical protein